MMISVLFISLTAIVASFLGPLLGLGGGIIMIPALTLLFHVDIRYVIGASIISVIATSSGAAITYLKDHLTDVRIGMFLEIGTTLGAIIGAFLSGVADTRYLYLIFGLLMLYSVVMMLRKAGSDLPCDVATHLAVERLCLNSPYYDKSLDQEMSYQAAGVYGSLGMMYVAGTISGLLGIDSGVFKMMGMDLFMKPPMKMSSTMSNFMIGATVAASAGVYFFREDINPSIAASVVLGVLMGAIVGTRVMQRMKSRTIRLVLMPVLVITSVQMIVRGVLMG